MDTAGKAGQAAAGELTVLKGLCPGCRGEHVRQSATRITNRPQGMFPSMAFARVVDAQHFADCVASIG